MHSSDIVNVLIVKQPFGAAACNETPSFHHHQTSVERLKKSRDNGVYWLSLAHAPDAVIAMMALICIRKRFQANHSYIANGLKCFELCWLNACDNQLVDADYPITVTTWLVTGEFSAQMASNTEMFPFDDVIMPILMMRQNWVTWVIDFTKTCCKADYSEIVP